MRGFYTTYEVDDYGNVTKATTDVSGDTVTSADTLRTTVDRRYELPDEAKWLVARPKSEEVCGHAPIDDAAQRDKCRLTVMETNPNTGLLSKMTIGAHDPARSLETVPEYDVYGNVVATVATDLGSLEQRSVCTRYDDEGTYPLASVNALGHVTRRRWDARHGALLAEVDPNGLATQWTLDGFGRVAFEASAGGLVTFYTLDRQRKPSPDTPEGERWVTSLRSFSPGDVDTTAEFDRNGRPAKVLTAGFAGRTNVQRSLYRPFSTGGALLRRSLPAPAETADAQLQYDQFVYDRLGRLTGVSEADSGLTVYNYDRLTTRVTNRRSIATTRHYDERGLLARVDDPPSSDGFLTSTAYQYDPFGALVQATVTGSDNTSAQTRFLRDAFGRAVETFDPDRGHSRRE
jgi:YD repeat-containing protein